MATLGNLGRAHTLESAGYAYSPLFPSASPWGRDKETNFTADTEARVPAGGIALPRLAAQDTAANEVVTGDIDVPEPRERTQERIEKVEQMWPLFAALGLIGVAFLVR